MQAILLKCPSYLRDHILVWIQEEILELIDIWFH